MYGLDSIPRYLKEYERQWQSYDRFLRVRRSLDAPEMYLLERKTRYLTFPEERPASRDRCAQLAHGYRMVFPFRANEAKYVLESLKVTDIQRRGGAKAVARELENSESKMKELVDRRHHGDFEDVGGEAYDHMAWIEGRRVSMSGARK